MRKFRCLKYRSYNTKSPLGRSYTFSKFADTTAEYEGVFYPEDEAWMTYLTSTKGRNLLWWFNAPEEITSVTMKEKSDRHFVASDVITDFVPTYTGDIAVRKTEEQIQAEVNLANLADGIDVYGEKVEEVEEIFVTPPADEEVEFPSVDLIEDEIAEIIPAPEMTSARKELLENFAKSGKDLKKLKLLYNLTDLQSLCGNAYLNAVGTKGELISRLYDYYKGE